MLTVSPAGLQTRQDERLRRSDRRRCHDGAATARHHAQDDAVRHATRRSLRREPDAAHARPVSDRRAGGGQQLQCVCVVRRDLQQLHLRPSRRTHLRHDHRLKVSRRSTPQAVQRSLFIILPSLTYTVFSSKCCLLTLKHR